MSNNLPCVALYLRSLLDTGIDTRMLNLSQGLVERGINVDLVLNTSKQKDFSRVPQGVKIVDLKEPKLLRGLPHLINYLKQEKPQAILSAQHFTNEVLLIAKLLSRVSTRFVVSEGNTISAEWRNKPKLKERLTPLLVRFLYPQADAIIGNSKGVVSDIAKVTALPLKEINVVYNPTITPQVITKSREPVDHLWFKKGEPPVILGVGRLNIQKDFQTLIKAFAKVRKNHSCRLIILGNGAEKQNLKQLVKQLNLENDVQIPGFVDNPYKYMKNSQVFVLSSAWEGLPNVLIEAMAVGTPVVATNCPSGPYEILDGGKYGKLVPIGDEDKMAEAILSVLKGDFQPVDFDWLQQFTLESAIENYLDVLGIANS